MSRAVPSVVVSIHNHTGFAGEKQALPCESSFGVLYLHKQKMACRLAGGKGEETVECRTFALEELTSPKYVVVFTRYRGKLLLSRHRQRDTWETQGGHIEPGETPEQAARRTPPTAPGAGEFTLIPLCGYRAGDETGSAAGAVFVARWRRWGRCPPWRWRRQPSFPPCPGS